MTDETEIEDGAGFDAVRARFGAPEAAPDLARGVPPKSARAPRTPDASPDDRTAPPPEDPALAERLTRAAGFPLNDFGNGQRLIVHFGEDLMFVPRVGWHVWDGKRWAKDPDMLAARRRAQALAPLILREVDFAPKTAQQADALERLAMARGDLERLERMPAAERGADHDDQIEAVGRRIAYHEKKLEGYFKAQGRIVTHAKNAGNNGPLKHMLEEAQTGLAVPLEELDARPLDINVRNGVLRFAVKRKPGEAPMASVVLEPHDRAHRLTKMIDADYDGTAYAERFEAFLAEVQPDVEKRMFLQRWFGASMSAEPVQALLFNYGMGANGKSVLMDVLGTLLGDYAATVRIESLTGTNRRGGGDATPDLIPLIGARLVRVSEPDQGTRLQEGLIKELTGGEPILVRALHSDFVEVKPYGKITMSGNHKPEIRGTDDGIWRRVMLMPWEVQIPPERRNPRLAEELAEEASGILNWLIDGLLAFLELGLAPPASVTEATEEYRRESDPIGEFLLTSCTITGEPGDTITAADLSNAFTFYLLERGDTPWKPTTVSRQLADKAQRWRHPQTGLSFLKTKASISLYAGLRLTDAFRRRFDAAPKGHDGRPIAARFGTPDPSEPL